MMMVRYSIGFVLLLCFGVMTSCGTVSPSEHVPFELVGVISEAPGGPGPEQTVRTDGGTGQERSPSPDMSTEPTVIPEKQQTLDNTVSEQQTQPEPTPPEPPVEGPSSSGWVHPTQPIQGKATWYNADGSGNCSFPKRSSPVLVAAMNESQYGNADFCGACLRVKGPKGTVLVEVVDRCPGCKPGQLDLSKDAFSRIADLRTGVISIEWQAVACESKAPMQYYYKDGTSQWWTALQVRRHRYPITKLEVQKSGQWVSLKRERYNFFVDAKGFGKQSVRIRIHAQNGQMREDTLPPPASAKLVEGTKQFD
jgi:expansin (peptidoglycan-binding protein)